MGLGCCLVVVIAKPDTHYPHIVDDCPLSRFPGGFTTLHLAGDEAIKWLGMQCKR